MPFREAHEAVGHLVVWCEVNDCELGDVSDEDLAKVSPHFTPDVRERAVGAGRARGARHLRRDRAGPGRQQLAELRQRVESDATWAAARSAWSAR